MIHYQLRCAIGHGFEGWFRDSAAFEQQARGGLLRCPSCGSAEVDRGLMAPAVRAGRHRIAPGDDDATATRPSAGQTAPAPAAQIPDALRAELQRLRAAVERDCEDMGDRFAQEAIRMHHGEAEARGIYGNTTARDRDALADAGVAVVSIPWLKPADG